MRILWQDIRYGLRMMAKVPGFTFLVVLILALGIGINTAIFSIVNAVFLKPLPFEDPERLVVISSRCEDPDFLRVMEQVAKATGLTSAGNCRFDFQEIRKRNHVFEHAAAIEAKTFVDVGGNEAINVLGACVSDEFFSCLGVRPILGREFGPEDNKQGNDQVVILGHQYWKQRYGSDPGIIGRNITFKDGMYTVVGIMPPDIHFLEYGGISEIFSWLVKESEFKDFNVWKPLALTPQNTGVGSLFSFGTFMLARLKPDVNLAGAQVEMNVISDQLTQEYKQRKKRSVILSPFRENVVEGVRPVLWILLGTVVFVLLIVCVNVANMVLVRSLGRRREVAIRTALGAGRLRLIRQFLTESTMLSFLGGLFAVILTIWILKVMSSFLTARMPRSSEIRVDGWVVCFALGISVLIGALIGVVSLLRLPGSSRESVLKKIDPTMRSTTCLSFSHKVLLICEVALSLVLLIGAGLMVKSFWRLTNVNLGFNSENVLVVDKGFDASMIDRVRQLPGVSTVAVGSPCLLPACNEMFDIVGRDISATEKKPDAQCMRVTEDYFETLQISLLAGRAFTSMDHAEAERVAIINQTIMRRYFPDTSPLGQMLSCKGRTCRIVGVSADVRPHGLRSDPMPMIYIPFAQADWISGSVEFIIRTKENINVMLAPIRQEFLAMNSFSPAPRMSTLDELLAEPAAPMRFTMQLLCACGALALVLALVGIYGLTAFSVSQRTQEIGIRMALGARAGDILKEVLRQGLALASVGIAMGLAGAMALTRVMSSFLYNISPTDPLTFVCVSLLLACAALFASYVPARRAAKIDPMEALRYE